MTKYLLLAGAMMISAPALAQTAPTAPVPSAMTTTEVPASTQAAPISDPATAAQSPTQTAAAAPASKEEQVTAVVDTEFPTYDKDSNGKLSTAEFGAWMVALKTASDPSTKADSAATKTWVGQAFANADKDKNKAVSKTELTGFLAQAG